MRHEPCMDTVAIVRYRVAHMIQPQAIEDLARRLTDLLPPSARAAQEDVAASFRSVLQSGLTRMNLVSREEFDVQRLVLLRTREKVEALERDVAALSEALGVGREPN